MSLSADTDGDSQTSSEARRDPQLEYSSGLLLRLPLAAEAERTTPPAANAPGAQTPGPDTVLQHGEQPSMGGGGQDVTPGPDPELWQGWAQRSAGAGRDPRAGPHALAGAADCRAGARRGQGEPRATCGAREWDVLTPHQDGGRGRNKSSNKKNNSKHRTRPDSALIQERLNKLVNGEKTLGSHTEKFPIKEKLGPGGAGAGPPCVHMTPPCPCTQTPFRGQHGRGREELHREA